MAPAPLLFPERPLSSAAFVSSISSSLPAAEESSFASTTMVDISESSPTAFVRAIGADTGAGVSLISRASQGLYGTRKKL